VDVNRGDGLTARIPDGSGDRVDSFRELLETPGATLASYFRKTSS
jgi:hypothetical protein